MKNKEFRKLLRKNKPNAGFTLFELLVGLVISSFVIGALGFGLITILSTTQTETSKIKSRSETSRAIEFIADEIKRASEIEGNASNANDNDAVIDNTFDETDKTIVLALDIPDISNNVDLDGDVTNGTLGSDNDPDTSERVVYYLETASGNWQGPQVLYRWGPPLDANGNYTEGTWQAEALIDGIDDTTLTGTPCSTVGGTLSPSTGATTGFYACISGDNTAQLFFNATNKTDDSYSADGKAVARARESTLNSSEASATKPLYFKTLGATYSCNTSGVDWTMRTDFNNSADPEATPNNTTPWLHNPDRQPQPININTNNPLKISSSPVGATGCISTGNEGTTGTEDFSTYTNNVSLTIDFSDVTTFNGDPYNDQPDVTGDKYVMVYRKGSPITALDGYDPDGDPSTTTDQQQAIADFLVAKKYAVEYATGQYRIANDTDLANDSSLIELADNERIITFEVGQTDNGLPAGDPNDPSNTNAVNEASWATDNASGEDDYYDPEGDGAHAGFDGQDNVFIISTDGFDTTP